MVLRAFTHRSKPIIQWFDWPNATVSINIVYTKSLLILPVWDIFPLFFFYSWTRPDPNPDPSQPPTWPERSELVACSESNCLSAFLTLRTLRLAGNRKKRGCKILANQTVEFLPYEPVFFRSALQLGVALRSISCSDQFEKLAQAQAKASPYPIFQCLQFPDNHNVYQE